MALSAAVAVIAVSYLAIDATVDLNAAGLSRRLQAAQASMVDVAKAPRHLAFAVQAWVRHDSRHPSCAID
jgi:hypothetical protein